MIDPAFLSRVSPEDRVASLMREILSGTAAKLQKDGLISSDIGSRRDIPAGAEAQPLAYLKSEMDAHQIKRNAGMPLKAHSTPVEDSYQSARKAHMAQVEGFKEHVYKDHKGIATVGLGINLEDPSIDPLLKSMGVSKSDATSGKHRFTPQQLDLMFEHKVADAEKLVSKKFGKVALTQNQRLALVSLAYNTPNLIGPNLTAAVNGGDWEAAEEEIRYRSNLRKHKGIQNRRNQEADLFAVDTHDPKPPYLLA